MTQTELKQYIENIVNQHLTGVTVKLTKNTRVCGTAYTLSRIIKISYVKCKHYHFNKEFIDDLVLHEVAHIKAYEMYGEAAGGHGDLWKSVALSLGCKNPSHLVYVPEGLEGDELTTNKYVQAFVFEDMSVHPYRYLARKVKPKHSGYKVKVDGVWKPAVLRLITTDDWMKITKQSIEATIVDDAELGSKLYEKSF